MADPEDLQWLGDGCGVHVDTNDLFVALFQLGLITERRVGDLCGEPAFPMPRRIPDVIGPISCCCSAATEFFDPVEDRHYLRFDLVGKGLDVPGSTERISHIGHPGFLSQDLLGAQRDLARFSVGSASVSSIAFVCSELDAQDGSQRLDRSSYNVVVGLLRKRNSAVWVGNRSDCALTVFAPYRSRSHRAQIRRAARNFAISSKKSMCASKKKLRPGAKRSMSKARDSPSST